MRVSELTIGDRRRCKSPISTMGGQDNGRTRAELWTRRVSMMGRVLIFRGRDQVVQVGRDGGGVGLAIDAMTGRGAFGGRLASPDQIGRVAGTEAAGINRNDGRCNPSAGGESQLDRGRRDEKLGLERYGKVCRGSQASPTLGQEGRQHNRAIGSVRTEVWGGRKTGWNLEGDFGGDISIWSCSTR
jgi:hypothetical protein